MNATPVHVAVGVVLNPQGDVLISRRGVNAHQRGKWEFPGGKVEPGEAPFQALQREMAEELGVILDTAEPLIQIPFVYPEKTVLLDVWISYGYTGLVTARENQQWCWAPSATLRTYEFPPANKGIIDALCLPGEYVITPNVGDEEKFFIALAQTLKGHKKILQFRDHSLSFDEYIRIGKKVSVLCRQHGVLFFLNGNPDLLSYLPADGIHLPSRLLRQMPKKPSNVQFVSVACHNDYEMELALQLEADLALISPVQATRSHPQATPLGWHTFKELATMASFPVYALGGVSLDDLDLVKQSGGHGIAGISAFWA